MDRLPWRRCRSWSIESMVGLGSRNKAAGSEVAKSSVMRGVRALRSKCSFINQQEEVRQARFRDSNRCNEGKAESATGAMQRSGQAADRGYQKEGRVKRQTANGQSHISSPGKHRKTHSGKPLGNVRRG